MRKVLLLVCVLALALGITYLILHKNGSGEGKPELRDIPLSVNSKSSAFNKSFNRVLNSYYRLSDSFVAEDSVRISSSSDQLRMSIDSIRFDQFKADSSIIQTAMSLATSIQGEIKGLEGEKGMELKRREFNMITDELYSLIRTVRYDGNVIYHIRCPAAFSDSSEAYWLAPTNKIENPYLGKNYPASAKNLPEYGEVSDSLRFSAPASE